MNIRQRVQNKVFETYSVSRKWLLFTLVPGLHQYAEKFFNKITREPGSNYWSALKPTKKWNIFIIRSVVAFSGITIVWASVTSVDESVQATGKLNQLAVPFQSELRLAVLLKKFWLMTVIMFS